MRNQKIIPFPLVKKVNADAAHSLPSRRTVAGTDDIEDMLDALRHAHAMGQIKGAVLSVRSDDTEGLYLVGDYAHDLDAAQQAVNISALVIQAKRRHGKAPPTPV